jgi:hypothetical protein
VFEAGPNNQYQANWSNNILLFEPTVLIVFFFFQKKKQKAFVLLRRRSLAAQPSAKPTLGVWGRAPNEPGH